MLSVIDRVPAVDVITPGPRGSPRSWPLLAHYTDEEIEAQSREGRHLPRVELSLRLGTVAKALWEGVGVEPSCMLFGAQTVGFPGCSPRKLCGGPEMKVLNPHGQNQCHRRRL